MELYLHQNIVEASPERFTFTGELARDIFAATKAERERREAALTERLQAIRQEFEATDAFQRLLKPRDTEGKISARLESAETVARAAESAVRQAIGDCADPFCLMGEAAQRKTEAEQIRVWWAEVRRQIELVQPGLRNELAAKLNAEIRAEAQRREAERKELRGELVEAVLAQLPRLAASLTPLSVNVSDFFDG